MKLCYIYLTLALVGLYLIPAFLAPATGAADFALSAQAAIDLAEHGSLDIADFLPGSPRTPIVYIFATALNLKLFGFSVFALRLAGVLAIGAMAWLLFWSVRQCTEDKGFGLTSALAFLGACSCLIGVQIRSPQVVNAFLMFGLSNTLFFAYREEEFSFQRIWLLILAGVLYGFTLISCGVCLSILPLLISLPFLIWEKRTKELLLMPWIPLAIGLGMAVLWCSYRYGWSWQLMADGLGAALKHLPASVGKMPLLVGLLVMFLLLVLTGIPALFFIGCAIRGFRGRRVYRQRFFRYTICAAGVWALGSIVAILVNAQETWVSLFGLIAALSVIFANGFVYYLRTTNKYRLFNSVVFTIAGSCLLLAILGMCFWRNLLADTAISGNELLTFLGIALCGGILLFWVRRHTPPTKLVVLFALYLATVIAASHSVITLSHPLVKAGNLGKSLFTGSTLPAIDPQRTAMVAEVDDLYCGLLALPANFAQPVYYSLRLKPGQKYFFINQRLQKLAPVRLLSTELIDELLASPEIDLVILFCNYRPKAPGFSSEYRQKARSIHKFKTGEALLFY